MATHTAWKGGQPDTSGAIAAAASATDWKEKPSVTAAVSASESGIITATPWKAGEPSAEGAITAWKAGDPVPGEGSIVAWKGEATGEGPVPSWKGDPASEASIQTHTS